MADNSIKPKNIAERYGKSVTVDHLDLEIPVNSFISLLGPPGCGKTTTLRMIAGLGTPTEGEIWIGDQLVFSAEKGTDVPPNERNVGFLFQDHALWSHMTMYKGTVFGLGNMRWNKKDIRGEVEELCVPLQLTPYLERCPSKLSGGQQQGVTATKTLATSPQIPLMDKPLSNLNAKLRLEMCTGLKYLHSTSNATSVYVTHDQLGAMALSTSICLMNIAMLQQYALPLRLYVKPVNMFVVDPAGSPATNLVGFRLDASSQDLELQRDSNRFLMEAGNEAGLGVYGGDMIVGIRPEDVATGQEGSIPARVISLSPHGMETTVIVEYLRASLYSVVFGSVSFPEGEMIKVSISGTWVCIFHRDTRELILLGKTAHRQMRGDACTFWSCY